MRTHTTNRRDAGFSFGLPMVLSYSSVRQHQGTTSDGNHTVSYKNARLVWRYKKRRRGFCVAQLITRSNVYVVQEDVGVSAVGWRDQRLRTSPNGKPRYLCTNVDDKICNPGHRRLWSCRLCHQVHHRNRTPKLALWKTRWGDVDFCPLQRGRSNVSSLPYFIDISRLSNRR